MARANPTVMSKTETEAKRMAERISKLSMGEQLTYAELSTIAGRDVQKEGRNALIRARKYAEREGVVTGTVMSIGIRRLNDTEIVNAVDPVLKSIERKAKRGAKTVMVADREKLSADQKIEQTCKVSLFIMVQGTCSTKGAQRIKEIVEKELKLDPKQTQLTLQQTLEAFKAG